MGGYCISRVIGLQGTVGMTLEFSLGFLGDASDRHTV